MEKSEAIRETTILTLGTCFEKSDHVWLNHVVASRLQGTETPMLLAFLILLSASVGGFALTYLLDREMRLMTRILAGHVIGTAIWGTIAFVLGFFLGIETLTALMSLALAMSPVMLLRRLDIWEAVRGDWNRSLSGLNGRTSQQLWGFVYYAGFLALFIFFFDRAIIVKDSGIFTGGSHNFGDLPAHLGAIFAFSEGGAFPPDNPSFAGSTFTYPFLVDLIVALLLELGITIQNALLVQNVFLAMSLLVLMERFAFAVTAKRFIGRLVPVLFLFGGGLGFVMFFNDYMEGGKSLFDSLFQISKDFTITDGQYRWGNPMIVLLLTQRSFLIGIPIALIALVKIWEIFTRQHEGQQDRFINSALIAGVIAGMLPLVHVHTLSALFIVCAVLFFFDTALRWKEWVAFGIGVALIAVPELMWLASGSASDLSEFIRFEAGWEMKDLNPIHFWILNTGFLIPLFIAGAVVSMKRGDTESERERLLGSRLITFSLPFVLIFVIGNFVMLAPWSWDNIKILTYWFIGSLPLVAVAIHSVWNLKIYGRIVAAALISVMVLSGGLDVWRTASSQIEMEVFNSDHVAIAEQIRAKTPPDALFLNAPTHNSPLVLTGRRSLMRYPGHLFSYGIDHKEREEDVRHIYAGGPVADEMLLKYQIDYILVSDQEKDMEGFAEQYFGRFEVVASTIGSKVYKVR